MGQDFVKGGGTSSSADDQRKAMNAAEAEKRRRYQDNVQEIAKVDPNHARLYTKNMGSLSDNASIVLKVENRDRSTRGYLMCNLIAEEHNGEPGFLLVMICPYCYYVKRSGAALSHITLRSWHRPFSLDPKHAGTLWVSPLGNVEGEDPEACTLAGSIHTHETQTCPTCAYRFEIGPARLDANEPPCSGAIRPV
jgi:rubrerythrin